MSTDLHEHESGDAPPAPRRLARDTEHRTVAGVAAGLGRHTGIDPVVFRVIFVVSTIFGGVGIVLYAVGWLFLPADGDSASPVDALIRRRGSSGVSTAFTVLLVLVACGALATAISGHGDAIAVLILLTVAAVVLLRIGPRRPAAGAPAAAVPEPPTTTLRELAATPGVLASHAERALVADLVSAALVAGLLHWLEADERIAKAYGARTRGELAEEISDLPPAWIDEWERGRADAAAVDGPPPPTLWDEPRRRSLLGPVTLFAAALAVGAALLVDAATGVDLSLVTVLGIGVGVIGLGLVLGAWYGRARWLVLPAVPLALLMLGASIVPVDLHGGMGQRTVYADARGAVAGPYRLGIGELTLDLTGADFRRPVHTSASVGVGEVVLRVPRDVDVTVHGYVRLGNIDPGDGRPGDGGYDVRRTITDRGPDGPGGGSVVLDASVDIGQVEVLRA